MAGRKKAEPKEKKKTLLEFNVGYPLRPIKEGDLVPVYKIPYKAKWELYKGRVLKVIEMRTLGAYVELERIDTGKKSLEFIYLGKIYEGWDKPFS
jgi:hypothetical protein